METHEGRGQEGGTGMGNPPTPTPGSRGWMEVVDAGMAPMSPEKIDTGSGVLTTS